MKNKLLFIHGYGTNGSEMTWMHNSAESLGKIYDSKIPTFPNSSYPVFSEWRNTLFDELENWAKSDELVVVAHSLGAAFIMMLANKLKFKKLIAVAPGYVGHISRKEYYLRSSRDLEIKDRMYSFFEDGGRIDPDNVAKNIEKRILVYSKDDQKIKDYTKKFFVESISWDQNIVLNGYGHFMTKGDNPTDEFNELINLLKV